MRLLFFILILLALCGCSILDTKVERAYSENRGWSTAAAYTTADTRIILQRDHPLLHNPVICVQPSPDVADALSSAAAITASGGSTTIKGDLSFSGSSTDAITELAGRSTALLGLRDGLFEACVAYSNGAIGQDVYSLIVSRYSQLMATLFLGQDISSAAVAEGHASATSAAPATPPATDKKTTSMAGGEQAAAAIPADQPPAMMASASPRQPMRDVSATTPLTPELIPLAVGAPVLEMATENAPVAAKKKPVKTPKPAADAKPPTATQATPGSGNGASTADALALTRMNEDYGHGGLVSALVVACINEFDPTRLSAIQPQTAVSNAGYVPTPPTATTANPTTLRTIAPNTWLAGLCNGIDTVQTLEQFEAVEQTDEWSPVDPEVAAEPGLTKASLLAASAKVKADPTIKALQTALIKAGYDPGPVDGVSGPGTMAALQAFETAHGL